MSSLIEKSLPINPITNQQMGKPSQNYHYNKTIQNYINTKTQKSTLLKQNYSMINDDQLQKKVNQFMSSKYANQIKNCDQYHDEFCVCADCTYERNLNKPSHSLFNLTMRSIYKQSYKNNFESNDKAMRTGMSDTNLKKQGQRKLEDQALGKQINQKESSISPNKKVSLDTIYNTELNHENPKQKTKIIRNEDNLKFVGPIQEITMYKQKFPGVYGDNQYVKPISKAVRQNFKLDATTMNQTFYKGQFTSRSPSGKIPDSLKTGLPLLLKQSTSHKFYSPPENPQLYNNKKAKTIQKRNSSPNDKHQYESTYRNSFYGADILESIKHKKRLIRQTISKLGMSG